MAKREMKKQNYERVDTPTMIQMEAVECGAACLGMVLGYHKKFLPLSELRETCGVSRDGSKASNVVRAGEIYGMKSDGYQKEPEELKNMQPPMILHWNFNHFVVLEGFEDGKAYINDPGEGKRVIEKDEFNESFTGIVLTFKKTSKFVEGGRVPSIVDSLKEKFEGIKVGVSFIVIAGLALIIPGLIIPTLSKVFIDKVLLESMDDWVIPILGGLLFMGLLQVALSSIQKKYLTRLREKIEVLSSSKFFWHILQLPMNFFYQRYSGDIISRVNINKEIASVLSGEIPSLIIDMFMILFYGILMIQYSVLLTVVGIITGIINIFVMRYLTKGRVARYKKMLQSSSKLYSMSMSGIKMIESIKAGGGERGFFSKWSGEHVKLLNLEQKLGASSVYTSVAPSLITVINGIAMLSLGSIEVLQGKITIGMLIAFQGLMANFISPINNFVSFIDRLKNLKSNVDRLDDVLDTKIDPAYEFHTIEPENVMEDTAVKLEGYIELKNITFGYSPLDPPLIKDFSLTLKPGARVAIVGMSGSGKSTITKIISGLYHQWSGDILFDGVNRKDLPKEIINNSLSVIDQEIIPFEGSVRDNIKLWDSTISDDDMVKATIDADIHDAIVARKSGYHFPLKEDGSGFSGGQLQRIEISRALATNPTILIMDEATSALDTKTELHVDDAVRRRGCTTVIVAHRLSTIRDSNEIIVLDKGIVVQRGTHEELMKDEKGLYAVLVQST